MHLLVVALPAAPEGSVAATQNPKTHMMVAFVPHVPCNICAMIIAPSCSMQKRLKIKSH